MSVVKVKKLSKRKQQIFYEAEWLFRSKGFAATTMRDLAKAVGVEAASLYSHVKSKEEILIYICFSMAEKFFNAFEQIENEDCRPDEKMEKAIEQHVSVITDNLNASAVFFHEWKHLTEPYLSDFKLLQHKYEEKFATILDDGVDKWIFKPQESKFYCIVIFSSMNMIHEWYDPEGNFTSAEIASQISKVLLDGIKQ